MTRRTAIPTLALLWASGCVFNEHLPEVDITGTVVVPRAAATRAVTDSRTGEVTEVIDVRFIGPVYLGAFSGVNDIDFAYPHPNIGPVISSEDLPDTYPYGGGTVGRFAFACYSSTACEVVTGRYTTFDDLLGFFSDVVGDPITDEGGTPVASEDYYRSYCYDLFEYTADFELQFLEGAKENLQFQENADGDFEATFNLWHTVYKPGMRIWGWVDTPSSNASNPFSFSTCNPNDGLQLSQYNADLRSGNAYTDLLNRPSTYVSSGDWVVGDPPEMTWEDADTYREENPSVTVVIDFPVEEN